MYWIMKPVDPDAPLESLRVVDSSVEEQDWSAFGPNTVVERTGDIAGGTTIVFDNRADT